MATKSAATKAKTPKKGVDDVPAVKPTTKAAAPKATTPPAAPSSKALAALPKAAAPTKPAAPDTTTSKKKTPPAPPPATPPEPEPPAPKAKQTRHLRAPIEIRVEITARNQSFTTTSRNIALGGISFESQQQFRVGDLVNVILYIPVRKDLELLKAASEVVWEEDLGGSWMCGAAFRKFAPGDERRLREWLIESVRAQKAGLSAIPTGDDDDDDDDEG